jgi:Flp pilus assembly protein TadD
MTDADRIAEFKEVAELMPDDPVVRFGLAGAYLQAPDDASARATAPGRGFPDYNT